MMAGKRLPLPKARAAKALHPVEAIAEGASTSALESAASSESTENIRDAESSARLEASLLAESSTSSQSSELLEIAEALESTAAMASMEAAETEESLELAERAESTTSRKSTQRALHPDLPERVDRAAVEVLQRPPDAPTVGHYRRSFMLDPETLALIDELRWHLRCDKSEVVRRAVDLLARQAGLREEAS